MDVIRKRSGWDDTSCWYTGAQSGNEDKERLSPPARVHLTRGKHLCTTYRRLSRRSASGPGSLVYNSCMQRFKGFRPTFQSIVSPLLQCLPMYDNMRQHDQFEAVARARTFCQVRDALPPDQYALPPYPPVSAK